LGALERNNWIQSRAAKDLGLTLRQVGYRVRKYGLEAFIKNRQRSAGLPDVQEPGSAS
jgi:Nif-specific regulatory protein